MKKVIILLILTTSFSCQNKKHQSSNTEFRIKKVKEVVLSEAENPIGIVSSAKMGEDSILYILDISASDVKLYDLDGNFIKRIGGKGRGPDQLLSPRNFCISNQHVIVGDLGNYTIKWFSKENSKLSKSVNLNKYRPVFGESIVLENKIITTGLWDGERNYDDAVLILDTLGNIIRRIGAYPSEYPEYQKLDGTAFIDINRSNELLLCFMQSPSISVINLYNQNSKSKDFLEERDKYVSEVYKKEVLTIEDFEKINLSIFYNTCIRFFNDTLIVRGVSKHNAKSSSQGSFTNATNACQIYSRNFEKLGEFEIKGVMRDVIHDFIIVEESDMPNNRIYALYKIEIIIKK